MVLSAKGVSSIKLNLRQDVFDEVTKLIIPIAETYVLEMKVDNQKIKKKVFLLGEKEVASASNIKFISFDIHSVAMPIQEGHIDLALTDIAAKISMDFKTLGVKIGKVVVDATLNINSKVKFGAKAKTQVFDTKVEIDNFDTDISGLAGPALAAATEAIANILEDMIENTLAATIKDGLESALDSVMMRDWDVMGNVAALFYKFHVDFLTAPRISKATGVEFSIAIDSEFQAGKAFEPDVQPVSSVVAAVGSADASAPAIGNKPQGDTGAKKGMFSWARETFCGRFDKN
ncbi:hypothetical protein CcCBS67573_g01867 [Chytriomyces confervae]|uniref:Lipid-binding serum glycoprotein N-terminal domain-containing protein n=1 Tax=Chytriomyces confervae TaxID=246404 RepID=A0A507FKD3_9FUNG|nr:hypothetical protein HDU80_008271 [Chytriomyces hyalinus]TPX76859.1 hypothetical protein CcCBS67573_g01867 [Chytriomyces confervae]